MSTCESTNGRTSVLNYSQEGVRNGVKLCKCLEDIERERERGRERERLRMFLHHSTSLSDKAKLASDGEVGRILEIRESWGEGRVRRGMKGGSGRVTASFLSLRVANGSPSLFQLRLPTLIPSTILQYISRIQTIIDISVYTF